MQVLKFGGTSVANAENIRKVSSIIKQAAQKDQVVAVVSALGGITDLFLQAARKAADGKEDYKELLVQAEQRHLDVVKELIPIVKQSSALSLVKKHFNEIDDICNGIFLLGELTERTTDKILSYGELISSQIISSILHATGVDNSWKDSRELISTDSSYTHASVDFKLTNEKVRHFIEQNNSNVFILPGFIGSDSNGITTTLGRGGSDYTAAIVAAAVKAADLEIWTDVNGMMTADPRMVSNAKAISEISYQEAMELSHFGAKVLYPPTVQPVLAADIPVWIKNTFAAEQPGTLIKNQAIKNGSDVRGISSISKVALLSLEGSGMVGIPGFSKRLFEALASTGINVILITQSSSEHSICVGIDDVNAEKAKKIVDKTFAVEIKAGSIDPLTVEQALSIVALVGDNMKNHPGISGKMFGALGRNGVNVRAIAQGSSERNISAVISTADVKKAINVLHEEFFENTYKQVNLFLTGVGNVGSKLLAQLQQQQQYLLQHLRLQLKVVGIGNSKKMFFNDDGIDLSAWQSQLEHGDAMNMDRFIDNVRTKNLRNSVFADVTASPEVADTYDKLFEKSVSIVACNKVACSSPYLYYKKLKDLAREHNALFLFETNVGAGLPVIGTLNDLLRSGDKVNRIQAVLSGTLNFVFNHYNATRPFAQVVKQAQDEGYTEPDPRLDLGGTDVMRKIMILAREAGEELEMEDITNNSFMPTSCMQGDVNNFYKEMEKHEGHFKKIYEEAAAKKCKLKFVASYESGKASVGLQHIDAQHDFYHLYGKDNVVLFYTNRYVEQPLVVKGAGAGAEVTASGVFADIIRAARI
jgi:aspartokinase/homoserine dehydrogenase 1